MLHQEPTPIKIRLRGRCFFGFVSQRSANRLYIQVSTLSPYGWGCASSSASMMGDILKLAMNATSTNAVQPYQIDGRLVLRTLLIYHSRERQKDCPGFQFDNLDTGLRNWVVRQGFSQPEDIKHLEQASGYLIGRSAWNRRSGLRFQ